METNSIKINDSFVVNALRNCGYNNYAAIADIIDNSIEPNVNASRVEITLENPHRGEPISSIIIADNGSGMSYDNLKKAMDLGAQTGKNGKDNLGLYGVGLKTAALSIGQRLEVYTVQADDDTGSIATLDLTDEAINRDGIKVSFATLPIDSVRALLPENASSGTVVKIEKIDRIYNTDRKNFGGVLRRRLGEIFGKYISIKNCSFFVDNREVKAINPMLNPNGVSEPIGNGSFTIDGHTFTYNAVYFPKDGAERGEGENEQSLARNPSNQGIYIFRQNRLVGRALTLGLWTRHPELNSLRIELCMDGTCDNMFGAPFTKLVNEPSDNRTENAENISKALWDKLQNTFGPYIQEVKQRAQAARLIPPTDPETLKMYDNVTQEQNGNLLLRINRRGENAKPSETKKDHATRGPQKHPNPTRERKNKWLDGFQEVSLGIGENMYSIHLSNNRTTVQINTDHPFFTEFYSKLDTYLKYKMAQILSCHQIAKSNVNYYGSYTIQQTIDDYDSVLSSEVRKSLKK